MPSLMVAAHLGYVLLVGHEVDDGGVGLGVELGGVGSGQAEDASRGLDDHYLHAKAKAEVWHAPLAGVGRSVDHTLDAPGAEAAGDDDAPGLSEEVFGALFLYILRGDPLDVDADGHGAGRRGRGTP